MNAVEFRLKNILPIDQYGQGSAKSFDSLCQEIRSGECQIEWEDDKPIRVIKVLSVKVNDPDGNNLFEAYQEFSDGRKRERGLWGISEKVQDGEDLQSAAIRAIKEELGIETSQFSIMVDPSFEVENKESPSYPGLASRYILYSAMAYIDKSAVKPEYIEVQADKKTVFIWR